MKGGPSEDGQGHQYRVELCRTAHAWSMKEYSASFADGVGEDRIFPFLSLPIASLAKGRPQQKGQIELGVRHFKEFFWVN